MPPHVIGLDLSLTATGISDATTYATTIKPRTLRHHQRLHHILTRIRDHTPPGALAAIEGPSYGSHGRSHHDLAGLWWITTHALWHAGTPYAVIPPACRAKYATGRGNAHKDEVLAATIKRWPHLDITDNNAADACILAAMARDHYQLEKPHVPQAHRAALTKCQWPDLP